MLTHLQGSITTFILLIVREIACASSKFQNLWLAIWPLWMLEIRLPLEDMIKAIQTLAARRKE
jgi:hypothetical protein